MISSYFHSKHVLGPRRLLRRPRGNDRSRAARQWLLLEELEVRRCLSASPALLSASIALPMDPNVTESGSLDGVGSSGLYHVNVDGQGLFTAQVNPSDFGTRLSLLDSQGKLLIQSEASTTTDPTDRVAMHVESGDYFLMVQQTGSSGGAYVLNTTFVDSSAPSQPLSADQGSYSVAAGDFNGDGIPDLATADYYGNQVLVTPGNGDGTFQPETAIPVGDAPIFITTADLGNDGETDIITANQESNNISVLMGNGDGTFQAALNYAAGNSPTSIAVGDFTGNGILDLAVTDQVGNQVKILLGNGAGGFTQGPEINTSAAPTSVAAADFTGNGRLDLAVATLGGSGLTIYQNEGDANFVPVQQIRTDPGAAGVIAAKLSGAGLPDLAVACSQDNTVDIFTNHGGIFVPGSVLETGEEPSALTAADFDGDGNLDLAVANSSSVNVSVFMGHGDGTFGSPSLVSGGNGPESVITADLTNDGRADLVTADLIGCTVTVLLGNGDGTFQTPKVSAPQSAPPNVVAADLTNNGIEDLIIANGDTNNVSILLGRGDGSFRAPILVATGLSPWGIAVADFTGDGILDMAVTNQAQNTMSIYLGNGNGTFRFEEMLPTQIEPTYISAADLDGDGHIDLVESNYLSNSVSIFYGNGDGTFQDQVVLPVGGEPDNPLVVDLSNDGRLDIVTPNAATNDLSVIMATGARSYAAAVSVPAGAAPWGVSAGDLSGNGIQDLVVSDFNSSGPSVVTVLMGNGDGTFHFGETIPVGANPNPVELADFTGNGKLDILTGNDGTNDLSLLMGNGDGTFQPAVELAAGPLPYGIAVADLNGDGKPDIAVTEYGSDEVTLLFNEGDGTFSAADQIPTLTSEIASASADFNGHGRVDLAVADPVDNTIKIELGNGDGTFSSGQVIPVGTDPAGIVIADLNGDGFPDLAVADEGSNDVTVMLGLGNGTFTSPTVIAVGLAPHSIVAGDFLNNGTIDIAVADEDSNNVAILIGRGDGTFLAPVYVAVGDEPVSLVAADLARNGRVDLVTANRSSGDLTILWNLGDGNFSAESVWYGGHAPSAVAVGNFTGNGSIDIAVADEGDDSVTLLRNLGGGVFGSGVSIGIGEGVQFLDPVTVGSRLALAAMSVNSQSLTVLGVSELGALETLETLALANLPAGIAVGDFNGDGISDLAVSTFATNDIDVRLGTSNGQFLTPEDAAPIPQSAPIVVDWFNNGSLDVFELDQKGELILRVAEPGAPGQFEAPEILDPALDMSFRDITLIETSYGPLIAALDANEPVITIFGLGQGPGDPLDVQTVNVSGASLLVSITAGDLTRNGREDIVAVDRGNDQLIILYQGVNGTFQEQGAALPTEQAPSEVTISDLNLDSWPDIVVSNTYSGDLSVFYGSASGQFSPEVVLNGGLGAAQVVDQGDDQVRSTSDDPTGLTTGYFSTNGLPDIVSVQSGADRISLLDGTPGGGIADPSLATSLSTGIDPTQVVAAALTRHGLTDLVVLNQGSDSISIFLNDGHGGFRSMATVDAGNNPTGIAVRDVNRDGVPDLLVSNQQGDLLIILGNGDGTFKPYERADQSVSLAVGDFGGNGQNEFVLSNTSIDQLSIQYNQTQSFVQGRSDGLQAPGAVAVADLNGDGNLDLIVLNSGENDMLVYLGLGGDRFEAPLEFYTGTDPIGLTVAHLTSSGVPDIVVANAGSNDLSVFVGVGQGADWTLEARPRLQVGNDPVSTTVAKLSGDDVPDIVSVDQGSNNVEILEGVGNGFFDTRDAIVLPTGQSPNRAFVGKFDNTGHVGLAVLDTGSSDLTYYANIGQGGSAPEHIPTGGQDPITGVIMPGSDGGYATLYIADGGDDQITVFTGSASGLVFSGAISLTGSEQPTDIVITRDRSGQIQLTISAVDQNRIVLVTVVLGLGLPGQVPGSGYASASGGVGSGGLAGGSASVTSENLYNLSGFTSDASSQEASAVSSGSASAVATVSAAAGSAAVAIASVATSMPTLMSSAIGSFTALAGNLVQMSQTQVSDIMPLDHGALDTVAVLVAVSSFAMDDAVGGGGEPGNVSSGAAEFDAPSVPPLRTTRLERYLAVFDPAVDLVARDLLAVNAGRDGRLLPNGWRPENTLRTDAATAGAIPPTGFDVDSGDSIASETGANGNVVTSFPFNLDERALSIAPQSGSRFALVARPAAVALVLSAAAITWAFARSRSWFRKPAGLAPRMPLLPSPHSIRRLGLAVCRASEQVAVRISLRGSTSHRRARLRLIGGRKDAHAIFLCD